MKTPLSTSVLLVFIGLCSSAAARTYVLISETLVGDAIRQPTFVAARPEARPLLPGLRPPRVELLEDGLRRKQPRTIGSSITKAHESIIRNWLRSPDKRAHIKGMYAEALYLHENPKWGYVRSPIASQHDLYVWVQGRRAPFTAQVKTHGKGDPNVYARDMVKDHRSNLFLVPDDHVAGLKNYWSKRIGELNSQGLVEDALLAHR